jgi:hypothetical protein
MRQTLEHLRALSSVTWLAVVGLRRFIIASKTKKQNPHLKENDDTGYLGTGVVFTIINIIINKIIHKIVCTGICIVLIGIQRLSISVAEGLPLATSMTTEKALRSFSGWRDGCVCSPGGVGG